MKDKETINKEIAVAVDNNESVMEVIRNRDNEDMSESVVRRFNTIEKNNDALYLQLQNVARLVHSSLDRIIELEYTVKRLEDESEWRCDDVETIAQQAWDVAMKHEDFLFDGLIPFTFPYYKGWIKDWMERHDK